MSVRRVLGVVVALVCVGLLSSCSLLPKLPLGAGDDNPEQESSVEMQHIADAVKDHDAAALKKLFSPDAREKATDLDSGLRYFLSVFPSGRMTWKTLGTGSGKHDVDGKQTVELVTTYKVSADGKVYDLYFSDVTVDQVKGPNNVGIYSLGVVPYEDNPYTTAGKPKPFTAWESTFSPGIYVPPK